jgi:hypothetical protein
MGTAWSAISTSSHPIGLGIDRHRFDAGRRAVDDPAGDLSRDLQ